MSSSDACDGRHFDTWQEVRNYILSESLPGHYWRGVSDATWCLTSSLDRFASENHVRDRSALKTRLHALYKKYADELGDPSGEYDDMELWALGQHWGLPTTYLDWTSSPMVAAYFALTGTDALTDRRACIYRIKDVANFRSGGDISVVEPNLTPRNSRMLAQRGLFTETREGRCLIDELLRLDLLDSLHCVTFPMTLRDEGLNELRLMLIDDLQLFPDRVGVIRHVRTAAILGR